MSHGRGLVGLYSGLSCLIRCNNILLTADSTLLTMTVWLGPTVPCSSGTVVLKSFMTFLDFSRDPSDCVVVHIQHQVCSSDKWFTTKCNFLKEICQIDPWSQIRVIAMFMFIPKPLLTSNFISFPKSCKCKEREILN